MKSLLRKNTHGLVMGLLSLPAMQQAGADSASSDRPHASPTLKTVTVTATRREDSLQKVPVAITVVDGEQLERDNRNNVSSIVQQVPTLNYRAGASNKDTSLFIRGVGTISTSPGVEPSVATVIDGVVYARPGQSTLDLLDVERIEVLRGPQGTLFGKNASAGVLNIVSREIPEATQGYLDASHFGGGNENRLRFGLGGRLSDTLKGSLNASLARYDGNVENVANGHEVNGYARQGVRGKLVFEPDDALRLTLIGDHNDGEDTGVVVRTRATDGLAQALLPAVASRDNRRINSDYKTYVEDRSSGLSAQADWRLGDYTLTSISAWRGWDNTQYQDNDNSAEWPVTALHDKGEVDFDQVSQELRLASPRGEFFEYVVGAYLFHGRSKETYRRLSVNDGVADRGRADYRASNDSYALFGESTLNLTDRLRIIAGLRGTRDTVDYDHRRVSTSAVAVNALRPAFAASGSHHDQGLSGRLGLQYDFSDEVMGYLTYSRGYKGPAYNVYFNMQAIDVEPLDPETSDTYEVGLKSSTLDGRLTANLALFHSRYDNYQANFFDQVGTSVVTRLINAGTVASEGAELDYAFQATDRLKLSGAFAYVKARVDSFQCPSGAAATCDIDGGRLPFSPDWKSYARVDYVIALDNGWELELATDYGWQSAVQFSLDQNRDTVQGAYGIWNASVALANYDAGWRVALLGRNLADTAYSPLITAFADGTGRIVPRDDRRYFGVQLRKDF